MVLSVRESVLVEICLLSVVDSICSVDAVLMEVVASLTLVVKACVVDSLKPSVVIGVDVTASVVLVVPWPRVQPPSVISTQF